MSQAIQVSSAPVASWMKLASRLTAALEAHRTVLFLADLDGTLAPIVRDPSDSRVPAPVRGDLQALAASPGVVVGIVSGRTLQDLRTRVGLAPIVYGGCHGLETAGPGLVHHPPEATAWGAMLAGVVRDLRARTAPLAGVAVEDKGLAVAVHYRRAPAEVVPRLPAIVEACVAAHPGCALLQGRRAFEIVPAGWDRGRWVRWVEEQVQARTVPGALTIYLGDDASDEAAFHALRKRGISVKVGGGPETGAAYRVEAVEDVYRVVAALADHVVGRATA